MSDEPLTYFSKQAFNPVNIGKYNYFVTAKEIDEKKEQLRVLTDKVRVTAINKLNFFETQQKGLDNIYSYTFYGGNDYPISNWHDTPKTFEELAGIVFEDEDKEKRKSSPGLVRLGVLRMDVDNLGSMFRRGLSADERAFSRYSVLSRSLDYYFKGYINEIWKNDDAFKNLTQVIYSGGDDLFIVGKWDVLIRMAEDINNNFRNWTGNNHELTISGGISIIQPKFPIIKAAIMSEREEKNAKEHKYGDLEKNSFSIFGYAFSWEKEWPFFRDLKNQVKLLLQEKQDGLSQGFPSDMYNLMQQAELTFNVTEKRYIIKNFEVMWLTAYNFRRTVKGIKNESVKVFLEKWVKLIFTGKIQELPDTKYHALQYLALAARWASLELR
jgi:CRISPR-associated protein Csm1